MTSINTYTPPQLTQYVARLLADPQQLLTGLTSSEYGSDTRKALLFHATPAQLTAARDHLLETERKRARRIADQLLTAAADAQGHAHA